jgi:hypothetical protein
MTLPRPHFSRRSLVAIVLVILIVSGGAVAASYLFTAGSGSAYETSSGLVVETNTNHGVGATNPFTGTDSVSINNVTFTASGQANVTVDRFEGAWTNVSAVDASSNNITIDPNDKPQATVGGGVTALSFRDSMSLSDDNVAFEYSSGGSGTVTVNGLAANTDYVATTPSGTQIDSGTADSAGSATISVSSATDEQVILFTNQAPVVDESSASPSGGEVVQTQNPTLSINVTDREFGTAQGDTVTATAYDASDDAKIASTTLNANGTASVTWSDPLTGSNSYYWVVEDSYGESTTTQDFDFEVPGTLRVFNESAPNTKIDDTVGLRVRFFATESGTVVERDVTNGTADLTGLPADQPIAITLKDETDGYIYRRITIDSIVEQQDIYLLPTQANSVQVVFELEDPTGQFAPEETRLLVEKPIKKDFDGDGGNETRYQTVSGDLFGSSGQYPAQLLQDERYRLRVLTEGGNERILGSYTAFGPATEPLQIEQIEPKADQDAGEALYGDVEVADGGNTTTATIRYQNLGDESTTVEYRILAGNQTVIGNVTSDADTFAHVYNVSSANATTFTVEYMIQKPTTTEYGQFKLGGIAGVAGRLNIDAQVLSIISWLLILSTMGLVVIVDPKLAPAGGTGMASGLVILGTVAIPAPVLGVAGAVSVLTLVGGGES